MKNALFFWFQIACVVIFTIFQVYHIWSVSTIGLSVATLLLTTLFVLVGYVLSVNANKVQQTISSKRTVIIYKLGVFIYSLITLSLLIKADVKWDETDSVIMVQFALSFLLIFPYMIISKLSFGDGVIRGLLALSMRVIPHTLMGIKILSVGGAGLSPVYIVFFHVLTLSRIIQISLTISESGWNRHSTGLLVAEVGNELSWTFVTLACLF